MSVHEQGVAIRCDGCGYEPAGRWPTEGQAKVALEFCGWKAVRGPAFSVLDFCRLCVKVGKHLGAANVGTPEAATADGTAKEDHPAAG